MKKVKGCLVGVVVLFLGAQQLMAINECIEGLQNEMISIIYAGQKMGEPVEKVEKKISRTFEQKCSEEEARQAKVQEAVDSKDCVRNLEFEMIRLFREISTENRAVDFEYIQRGVRENFEGCLPANP